MRENDRLFVIKRNGQRAEVRFDKIKSRLIKLCYGLDDVDVDRLCISVINKLKPGISTAELDSLAAESAAKLSHISPDYETLAARLETSNLHKQTKKRFSDVMQILHDSNIGISATLMSQIRAHRDEYDSAIVHGRDFFLPYTRLRDLMDQRLLRMNGVICERPQHMLMRVAAEKHVGDVQAALRAYEMSSKETS